MRTAVEQESTAGTGRKTPRGWTAITHDTAKGGGGRGSVVRPRQKLCGSDATGTVRLLWPPTGRRVTPARHADVPPLRPPPPPPPHPLDVAAWTVPLTHKVTRDEGAQHQGPRRHKNTSQNQKTQEGVALSARRPHLPPAAHGRVVHEQVRPGGRQGHGTKSGHGKKKGARQGSGDP